MKKIKNRYLFVHILISILFFILSAGYGWLMRLQQVFPFTFIERVNVLQAHSHVTFLGRGFLTCISLISAIYFKVEILNAKTLKISYWIMVISLASLLISFPLQGYKLFSIFFLTIFLVTSYVYLVFIYKKMKPLKELSVRFIKTGILYYFLSSLAIWLVPFLIVKVGKGILYTNTIYF